ncbi:uncharacterized protein EAF01_007539 [Botrytis porri]|uniref:uncharacterized protein n=1 Tax=Botrytis porri TaxID=87229 RepID=UPI00190235AB|nr:uncharacterized protein EAF01_007539 [Botrytis porri]KAF7900237.1 hypothetical protein EAF01_007539 [Botrytis porri]
MLILNGTHGGCRFCAVVWRAFRDEGVYRSFYSNNNTNALSLNDIARRFVINSLSLELKEGISKGGGVLVLVLDTLNGYRDFHKMSHSLTNTNHFSQERWRNFCYSSIRMCQETHELYNSASISEKTLRCLPTRLIDVECDPPRLILSSNIGPGSSYATISHCWGKAPVLTLTTKNIEAFQQGLPISHLNAIDVGERLLRDVNDSIPDWENEAPKMSQVYGNAFCCIAASAATDGSKGLFFPKNFMVDDVLRVNLYRAKYPRLTSPAPLNQRGWVVQERALTKRTLQFLDGEVIWKCQKRMASESFSVVSSCLKIPDDHLLFPQSPTANFNFRMFWTQLLLMYRKTMLSYPTDILMAIAGVARQFGEYLPTKNKVYLAGMWSFELERQLGWRATTPGSRFDLDRRECPSSNVAPSWSGSAINSLIVVPDTTSFFPVGSC